MHTPDSRCEGCSAGGGLRAKIAFPRGEIIFAEQPILDWPADMDHANVARLLSLVNQETRERLLLLPGPPGITLERKVAINTRLLTISHPDDDSIDIEEKPARGVFVYISKIQHSCTPNCTWYWEPKTKMIVLTAWCDIACGDELLADRTDDVDFVTYSYEQRKQALSQELWFQLLDTRDCPCPGCNSAERDASDRHLARFTELSHHWTQGYNEGSREYAKRRYQWATDYATASAMLEEARDVMVAEKKWDAMAVLWWTETELQIWWGQQEKALAAAREMQVWYEISGGEERKAFVQEKFIDVLQRDPSQFVEWGKARAAAQRANRATGLGKGNR